jgi:uncharacterized protein YoaH (UPF0181 family)
MIESSEPVTSHRSMQLMAEEMSWRQAVVISAEKLNKCHDDLNVTMY